MSASERTDGTHPLGSEFALIDRLAARLPGADSLPEEARETLLLGIGDDAAVWQLPSGVAGIFTIDTLVEGIHALPGESPESIGARALTAAVSDVAAMGGAPHLALVALQAPRSADDERLLRIYDGMAEEAGLLGLAVVGGDLVDTPGPLAVAIAVYGTAGKEQVWPRSGARPGDVVAITGDLGGSRAGLEILNYKLYKELTTKWADLLVLRHIRPHARVAAVGLLQSDPGVHAGVDISDGLSSDAWHIALGSEVTIRLERDALPLHPEIGTYLAWRSEADGSEDRDERDEVAFALDSGEEYELLVTLDPEHPALREGSVGREGSFAEEAGVGLSVVGRVEAGPPAVILVEGDRERAIEPGGFSHRPSDGGRA